MAKEAPVWSVSVDDSAAALKDISNDVLTVGVRTPSGVQDVTGVDKAGMERLLLLGDGEVVLTGVFNDAASMSHAVFKNYRTLSGSEVGRTVTIVLSGQTLSMEMIAESYDLARGADGSATFSVTLRLSSGTVPSWS